MDKLDKLSHIGSTRFWSRVGAVLGLLATLWATLIGKTLPELLASAESPVTSFHRAANRVCSHLPQSPTTPDLNHLAASRVGRTRTLSSQQMFDLNEQFLRKVTDPAQEVSQALFAIESPPQYASEYSVFEHDLTETTRGLYSLYSITYDNLYSLYFVHSDLPRQELPRANIRAYRRSLALILDHIRIVIGRANNVNEEATIMSLSGCVGTISWIETEVEGLGERLLGEPGAPAL